MSKIPPRARRVFKGEIFEVYQWEQEMFDGTHETFEMIKRPNTIQVIPTVGDKIVLAEEEQPSKPPFTSFLGGRGEEGEEPLVSAKRELLEEAGLESDDWEKIREYEPYAKIDWTIYLFAARNCRKVAEQHLDPGEKITLREVSFEEFLDLLEGKEFLGQEISDYIFRIRQDPKKLEDFRKKLFF